jgi:hypothetical protein
MDKLHEMLDEWLGVLDDHVRSLRVDQHIFWEVQRIIRNNPRINKPNDFYGWMARMYSAASCVAVRKMSDKNRDSISFLKFLEKLKANPEVISRKRYKEQFVDSWGDGPVPCCYSEHDADEGFDQMVGEGQQFLDPAYIDGQIQTLKSKTANLKTFVDKRIAHHDKSPFNDLRTFKELDDAIEYLEELLKYYWPLFRGLSMDSALPTWLYDWKDVFYFPWIEKKQD